MPIVQPLMAEEGQRGGSCNKVIKFSGHTWSDWCLILVQVVAFLPPKGAVRKNIWGKFKL